MSTVAILSKHVNESQEIAEHTASKLGYQLVTMTDLVNEAAKEGDVSESELSGVLTDLTLYHQLFRKRKMKLISLMELALCNFMVDTEMVFCGYLGLPIFQEISHVLQVLVLGNPEKAGGKDGGKKLFSDDKILKWFKKVYKVEMENPNLYDLTVNLRHMDESEGADIIIGTLEQKRFTPMTYSRKVMKDLQLVYRVKTKLIEKMPDVAVKAHDATVYIYSSAFRRSRKRAAQTKQLIMWMDGVDYVEILKDPNSFQNM